MRDRKTRLVRKRGQKEADVRGRKEKNEARKGWKKESKRAVEGDEGAGLQGQIKKKKTPHTGPQHTVYKICYALMNNR